MHRADPHLQEFIDLMDEHFVHHKSDRAQAFRRLSKAQSEDINREIERCVMSRRYYFANYHAIKTKSSGIMAMASLREPQEVFLQVVEESLKADGNCRIVCLKSRQLGISSISEAIVFHRTIFTPACNTLIVAQDKSQSSYLMDMSRLAYDSLPWWMRPEARYESRGNYMEFDQKDRETRQMNPGLQSAIYVESANRLTGVAVGKAIQCVHSSELSNWVEPAVLTEQIFPAMEGATSVLAILESTARGRDGFWYPLWRDTLDGKFGTWKPVFLGAYRMREYSIPLPAAHEFTLTAEEEGIRRRVQEDDGIEIPLDHFNWRRRKAQEFSSVQGDDSKLGQEYPESWLESFQATGVCAFSKKKLQSMLDTTCEKPKEVGEIDLRNGRDPVVSLRELAKGEKPPLAEFAGARLRVWERPEEGESYYLGADVAQGIPGADYSAVQVIRIGHAMEPDVQVAEWHGWETPTTFAHYIAALGLWYNECQVAVECNGIGNITNTELTRVIEYENVFQWKKYDKIKNFITDFLGWFTDHKTRDMIVVKMNEAVRDNTIIVRSEALIEEMFDFGNDGGSRFEAQSGHDDLAFAMMICRFCAHDSDYGMKAQTAPRDHGKRQGNFTVRTGRCNLTGALATWVDGDHFDMNWDRGTMVMMDGKPFQLAGKPESPTKMRLARPAGLNPNVPWVAYQRRRDFANSDFSPIFDRPGELPNRLVEQEDVPAEWAQEVAMHVGMGKLPGDGNEEDAWRTLW